MLMFVGLMGMFMGFCAVSEEAMIIGTLVFVGGMITYNWWGF